MIKGLMLAAIIICLITIATAPWISALLYSLISILQPHYIWPWAFQDVSVFKLTAGLTIIAWAIHALKGGINWRVYCSGQFLGMIYLFIVFHVSALLSPFKYYTSAVSADLVIGVFTSIFIMYFILIGLISKIQTAKYSSYVFLTTTLYYTYWANENYFSGNWSQFTLGRLRGPDGSPYSDGNTASILLTIGLSFVMFGISHFRNVHIKYLLLVSIPFLWHALFLFASRGALLSAVSVTVFFAIVTKSKSFTLLIIASFIGMLIWQGTTLTARTNSTIEQTNGLFVDAPINPRLTSWKIGLGLTKKYPLLGVGPQRFLYASKQHYPDKALHVAHNTFLNFSANTGLLAGLVFLGFFYFSYQQYKYVARNAPKHSDHAYINLSCFGGLIAFFVGALFLDLIIFEPFYLLLVLVSANYFSFKNNET